MASYNICVGTHELQNRRFNIITLTGVKYNSHVNEFSLLACRPAIAFYQQTFQVSYS